MSNHNTMTALRIFDLLIIFLSFIFIIPLMIVISIFIKIKCPGPVFFRQTRVGLDGQEFKICKFRTMVVGAEELGTSVTTAKDPRITPIGRILRKTKLDELPQVFNVLLGDMGLVGPRPEVPEIVEHYSPDMKEILSHKPGITNLATINMLDEEEILAQVPDPDDFYLEIMVPIKIILAKEHIRRESFAFDVKILFYTIYKLFKRRIPDGTLRFETILSG